VPPFLNFAPLENGFAALERTAKMYDQALGRAAGNGGAGLARAALRDVNAKLISVERALTLKDGLPKRDWFKHQIYAPGFYTGYGVKTLPAVRESIEQKDWKLAEEQIVRVGRVLDARERGRDDSGSGGGTSARGAMRSGQGFWLLVRRFGESANDR
jgi:N-acetylated-alpha-linked acidic dipeptidase